MAGGQQMENHPKVGVNCGEFSVKLFGLETRCGAFDALLPVGRLTVACPHREGGPPWVTDAHVSVMARRGDAGRQDGRHAVCWRSSCEQVPDRQAWPSW